MTAQPVPLLADDQEDPIARLYALAEAIHHVAETLPEHHGGLMCLLHLLGDDVQACTDTLHDEITVASSAPAG